MIDFVLRTLNLLSLLNNKCYKYEKVIKKKKTRNEKKKHDLKINNLKVCFDKIIHIMVKTKCFYLMNNLNHVVIIRVRCRIHIITKHPTFFYNNNANIYS